MTGGFLPLSAVLTSTSMYQMFYADYAQHKAFLHSHTYSGNALAAAVALECLDVIAAENIYQQVQENSSYLLHLMQEVALATGKLKNVRGIGAIVAADLITEEPQQRLGYAVYQKAVDYGALLRPLGNTIYWAPPLNTSRKVLRTLQDITARAICSV